VQMQKETIISNYKNNPILFTIYCNETWTHYYRAVIDSKTHLCVQTVLTFLRLFSCTHTHTIHARTHTQYTHTHTNNTHTIHTHAHTIHTHTHARTHTIHSHTHTHTIHTHAHNTHTYTHNTHARTTLTHARTHMSYCIAVLRMVESVVYRS
jgi:hypothetical protein